MNVGAAAALVSPFMPITEGEIELMRLTQSATLTDTATRIRDHADGDDGQGTAILRADSISLPCRPLPLTNQSRDTLEGESLAARSDAKILFEFGADVKSGDRLEIRGRSYSVTLVDGARAEALETVAYCQAQTTAQEQTTAEAE